MQRRGQSVCTISQKSPQKWRRLVCPINAETYAHSGFWTSIYARTKLPSIPAKGRTCDIERSPPTSRGIVYIKGLSLTGRFPTASSAAIHTCTPVPMLIRLSSALLVCSTLALVANAVPTGNGHGHGHGHSALAANGQTCNMSVSKRMAMH